MTQKLKLLKKEHSECLLCQKPLGLESKELGFALCHEHRKCLKCSMEISVPEQQWCLQQFLEASGLENELTGPTDFIGLDIIHPRCSVLLRNEKSDPTRSITQSEYDFLNLIRLSTIPDPNLSSETNANNAYIYSSRLVQNMDFETLSQHVKMIEQCLHTSLTALKQNPKGRASFDQQREVEKREAAKANLTIKAGLTEVQEPKKKKDTLEDLQLDTMVELHGLDPAQRDTNIKILKDRNVSIQKLMKAFKLNEQQAREMCDKNLIAGGIFKK